MKTNLRPDAASFVQSIVPSPENTSTPSTTSEPDPHCVTDCATELSRTGVVHAAHAASNTSPDRIVGILIQRTLRVPDTCDVRSPIHVRRGRHPATVARNRGVDRPRHLDRFMR